MVVVRSSGNYRQKILRSEFLSLFLKAGQLFRAVLLSLRQTWSSSWDKLWWDAFGQTWISMFELAKMQAHVGYFWLLCCLRIPDSCLVCQQCCQITGQRVPTFLRRLFHLLQFHQINVKTGLVGAQSHRSRTGDIGLSVVVTKPHDREGGRHGVCLW